MEVQVANSPGYVGTHYCTGDIQNGARDYFLLRHYIASQITSFTILYSTVYSDADHIKYPSSALLAFVWELTGDRWIPRTKGQ